MSDPTFLKNEEDSHPKTCSTSCRSRLQLLWGDISTQTFGNSTANEQLRRWRHLASHTRTKLAVLFSTSFRLLFRALKKKPQICLFLRGFVTPNLSIVPCGTQQEWKQIASGHLPVLSKSLCFSLTVHLHITVIHNSKATDQAKWKMGCWQM